MAICTCKYPLIVIDERDSESVEYVSLPLEIADDGIFYIPTIEYIKTEGLDGIIRDYVSVIWKKPADIDVSAYDVDGHVVIAGCEYPEEALENERQRSCDKKSIFVVMHPMNEWIERHIIHLSQ